MITIGLVSAHKLPIFPFALLELSIFEHGEALSMLNAVLPLAYMVVNLVIRPVYDPAVPMLKPIFEFTFVCITIILVDFPANALFHIILVHLTLKSFHILKFKLLVVSLVLKLQVLSNRIFLRAFSIWVI